MKIVKEMRGRHILMVEYPQNHRSGQGNICRNFGCNHDDSRNSIANNWWRNGRRIHRRCEGSSSYTLEIIDEDGLGDQGFIIFIPGTPGDFNGNGMHDYCENVIVNATHSGAWMSDPWQGWSSYNEPDETRQVFELEISDKSSDCDAQHWPKEKWINDGTFQLVKLGRACYGCMAGNTTITAEYANEPQTPVDYDRLPSMWIQDGEKINESTALTIIGAILTGIGVLTLVGLAIIKISKSKAAAQAALIMCNPPIEIIESNPGQPVRFRINDPPKGEMHG